MAAIIAQLTRANRERKTRVRIETSKCMYEIPPFDPRYSKDINGLIPNIEINAGFEFFWKRI